MSSSDVYSEDNDELSDSPSITPRAARGTRAKALKSLRSSLPEASVESYSDLIDRTFWKPDIEDSFNTTQNGVVIWTPHEKRIFFEVLDRKGRNGPREIAATIGTKSELEVQEYIRLLQKGVRRQHFNDGHARTAVLGEIQAAAEIGEHCCGALDDYAELLCLEEQRAEDSAGRRKHGSLWNIDGDIAEELEADAAEDSDNEESSEVDEKVVPIKGSLIETVNPTTTFFKLTKWILLSERFFMNFGGQRLEDNWVNVAFRGETPSLTADAVTDFYDLAHSVTRRLVHTALFFATSRIQRNGSATVVRASDVRSAARTLNMKPDSSEHWIGLARRCSLDVEDNRHKKGWNPVPLDYDDVETLLSQKELPQEPYETTTQNRRSRERSSSIASVGSADSLGEESNISEDEHAEAVDQQHNLTEELLCWSAIGQPPQSDTQLPQIPPKPPGKRKTPEELVDWRDRTLYRSEWEEFGHEAGKLGSEFENRRKKRRVEAPASSSRAVSESNIKTQDAESRSPSIQNDIQELRVQTTANPEIEFETDESDPEFHIGSQSSKSKSKSKKPAVSRTSSRKRTSVSYAVQPLSDFDMEMEMEIDVDSEPEDESSGSGDPDNQQAELEGTGDGEEEAQGDGES